MQRNNNLFLASYSLAFSLALGGCGSGSGGTNSPTIVTKSTYTISGTVPGTLIEAFCRDGSYHSVSSTNDGTSNHPFSIEIPKDVDCKFIMTTNEKDDNPSNHIVTPLLFDDGINVSSYFRVSQNIDIKHIPLPLSGTGIQTPLTLSNTELEVKLFSYDPLDDDNDHIPNVYEDDDNDGIVNKHDDDDNNDGTPDSEDNDYTNDTDGDGIHNDYDTDDDNDGIDDAYDDDDDDNDKDSDEKDDNYDGTTTDVTLPTTFEINTGRLLGAQCAQCHGTNGISINSWDSIVGEDNLLSEMYESHAPIMTAQAKGYTKDEIKLIENWLKTLHKD